jgi:hypothetical protein
MRQPGGKMFLERCLAKLKRKSTKEELIERLKRNERNRKRKKLRKREEKPKENARRLKD